jgi:hypothetical protein
MVPRETWSGSGRLAYPGQDTYPRTRALSTNDNAEAIRSVRWLRAQTACGVR